MNNASPRIGCVRIVSAKSCTDRPYCWAYLPAAYDILTTYRYTLADSTGRPERGKGSGIVERGGDEGGGAHSRARVVDGVSLN